MTNLLPLARPTNMKFNEKNKNFHVSKRTENEQKSGFMAPKYEQLSKILSYIGTKDNGILNNTIEAEKNVKDNKKFLQETQLYRLSNSNKLFNEYDKLQQPVYSHRDLDLIKQKVDIESSNARKLQFQQQMPLPIIKNIEDKSFILIHYALDLNTTMAFGDVLSLKKDIQTIILVDNKLNQNNGPLLFKYIEHYLGNIVTFRYVKNEMSQNLAQILAKGFFGQTTSLLRELTIDSSKIKSTDLNMILERAYSHKSRLRYLGLANINLNQDSIEPLCKFLVSSEYLLSFDIAWNRLDSNLVKILIEAALKNPNLRHLNLSWNTLTHANLPNNNNSSSDDTGTSISKGILILKDYLISHYGLLHLNLSYTKLSMKETYLLCEGMKLSCSLMSVHLTGNKLEDDSIKKISEKLNAKKIISSFLKIQKEKSHNAKIYQNDDIRYFGNISH